ncbi:MAG: phytanoyl-CoA dioxygenase family protein [Rhodospirillaceae bacterium]
MNKQPLQPVTQDHIDTYERDGVVLLQGMIDQEWVERLTSAWFRMRTEIIEGKPTNHLPQWMLEQDPLLAAEVEVMNSNETMRKRIESKVLGGKYMHFWDRDFLAYAMESPAAEIVGRVMNSDMVRFYWDQLFVKGASNDAITYWHTDYAAWPCSGQMLPSFWLALTPIEKGVSSLEFIAGSHKDETLQWPRTLNASHLERPADRPDFIDYESYRNDPDVKFLSFDMNPGDAVLIHPRTYHGAGANPHPTRDRIALTTRWLGDDITWDPRPECVNTPGLPLSKMAKGTPPNDDDLFPIAWRRSSLTA